jgi:RNA polymerase sigma factor (sigma-70 family)
MRKKKASKKKPTFEESFHIIDEEIKKRRNKWNLTSLSWMDYDDVSQIIRVHIYKKWHLYDPKHPLTPWLNRIITNQIKNLIRNNYGNYSRPCLKCSAAEGEDSCIIYSKQCSDCPLYKNWEKTKKAAYDLKIPLSLENHSNEIYSNDIDSNIDIEKNAKKIHEAMKGILKPLEWKIYKGLFIDNKKESEVAKEVGYITSEEKRTPGYKQIKNIKKIIINKVKTFLEKDKIDIY